MKIAAKDRDILRRLAEGQARIASLPVQREKAEMWRRLNDLEPVRPMVWINEIPWNEMNVGDESRSAARTRGPGRSSSVCACCSTSGGTCRRT